MCIKDALKNKSLIQKSIDIVAKLVNSAHKSNILKERLENIKKNLSSRNVTRWSSELNLIKSFLSLSKVESVFGPNLITAQQRKTLKELVEILDDFATITTLMQTDECSIGYVIPLIRGLNNIFAFAALLTPRFSKR